MEFNSIISDREQQLQIIADRNRKESSILQYNMVEHIED